MAYKSIDGVELLPNDCRIGEVSFTPSYVGTCLGGPYVGSPEITYQPNEALIEFMSFESWVRSAASADCRTSEQMTRAIFNEMSRLLGDDIPLCVVMRSEQLPGHLGHGPATTTIRRGM